VTVLTDGHTDALTDADRFYNLSHTICYSYGTDVHYIVDRPLQSTTTTSCHAAQHRYNRTQSKYRPTA